MSAQVEENKQQTETIDIVNTTNVAADSGKVELSKGEWTLEMTTGMGCLLVCESEEWNDFLLLCKDAIVDCLMKTDYYKSTERSQRRLQILGDLKHIDGFPSDFFSFFEAILGDRMEVTGCPEDNPIDHPVFLYHKYGATKKTIHMGPVSVKKILKESYAHFTKTETTYPVLKIEGPLSCYPSIPGPLDLTKDHKELMERDFEKVESILNSIVADTRKQLLKTTTYELVYPNGSSGLHVTLPVRDTQDKLDRLAKLHFSLQPAWQSYENMVIEYSSK
jgi:hypothetical protein